jgi:hypothetical protein
VRRPLLRASIWVTRARIKVSLWAYPNETDRREGLWMKLMTDLNRRDL